jgi:plasmid stabilization system protein ParE
MLAKKQIEWSHGAQADLSDIYALIVKDNPQAAEQVVNFVLASVANLMSSLSLGVLAVKAKLVSWF